MIRPIIYIAIVFFSSVASGKDINHRDIQRCVSEQLSSKQNYGVPTKELEKYCVCVVDVLDNQNVKNATDLKMKIVKQCALKEDANALEVENELRLISNEKNKRLPAQIDENVIQTTTSAGPGKNFYIFYSLVNHKKSDINIVDYESGLKPALLNTFCSEPTYEYFRIKNVDLIYQINDAEGSFVTKVFIKANDCKSVKEKSK